MKAKLSRSSLSRINEINLTPLMDLTFILLITFMITFPLDLQGIRLRLPVARASALPRTETQTISITADGAVYLEDAPIDLAGLAESMRLLREYAPDTTLLIRADEANRYGAVVQVLRVLQEAKMTRLATPVAV